MELIKTYIGLEVFMLQRTPLSQLSAVVRATMTMLFLECNKFGVNIILWNILSRGWLCNLCSNSLAINLLGGQ